MILASVINDWIQLINAFAPWIVALIIGIVSAIVNIWVTKWNIRKSEEIAQKKIDAKVLSSNRQNWIIDLRESISEYQANMAQLNNYFSSIDLSNVDEDKLKKEISRRKAWHQVQYLSNKIRLLLNPEEEVDHKAIIIYIDELYKICLSSVSMEFDGEKYQEALQKLHEISRKVLKDEWDRVKNVE